MDCPGTLENDFLNHLAKTGVQHSSIILYVVNSFSGISQEDFKFLRCQARNGSTVLFIFNLNEKDSKDILQEKISSINSMLKNSKEFSTSQLYVLDLLKELQYVKQYTENPIHDKENHPALYQLLSQLQNVVIAKMKGMAFLHARSFYNLLHTNFLLLSKIISHKMRTASGRTLKQSLVRIVRGKTEVEQKIADLNFQIHNLIKEADKDMAMYSDDLVVFYNRFLEKLEPHLKILANELETKQPYKSNDNSWIKNLVSTLRSKGPTPFEEEIYRALIDRFVTSFARVFIYFFFIIIIMFINFSYYFKGIC